MEQDNRENIAASAHASARALSDDVCQTVLDCDLDLDLWILSQRFR
jgi:hypothetical protein